MATVLRAPAPARVRKAPVRPRVVAGGAARRAPRVAAVPMARRRLYVMVATTMTFLCLFGVAALQVLITQGQFELARLQRDAAESQSRYDRLRLQVAELESPAHVVATAQRRLGMVPPDMVTYLSPVPVAHVKPKAVSAGSTTASSAGPVAWQQLKPHLDDSSTDATGR
ncbi:MAG: hypothetical protein LC792_20805 [Actinobacteria bacterium]|nr:hypothetical protein [Actinomycetota bacterium]